MTLLVAHRFVPATLGPTARDRRVAADSDAGSTLSRVVDVDPDAALDELYGVEPSAFVATRKKLAADLRAAGDKDGARALLAARRPSTAAWALNQLARR